MFQALDLGIPLPLSSIFDESARPYRIDDVSVCFPQFAGFGHLSADTVFKVCDQPHPLLVQTVMAQCVSSDFNQAVTAMHALFKQGYSSIDMVQTMFRVCKTMEFKTEKIRLEFIREIGFTQMRVAEGVDSLLQLNGLLARLCRLAATA